MRFVSRFHRLAIAMAMATLLVTMPKSLLAVDPPGYLLPWTAEVTYSVTQGWNTGSHTGANHRYAYDFGLPQNTPVRAARAGMVAWVKTISTGCTNDQSATGNGVVIHHGDGTATLYMHLAPAPDGVVVAVGNRVHQGALLGRSGNTGYVIPCPGGYHLHFNRQNQGGQPWTTSQPVYFEEYPGLQLSTGTGYVSRNYDAAVLFAHAPVPDPNQPQNGYLHANPRLRLRPHVNASDLRYWFISGPGPITPEDGWDNDASSIHVPEYLRVTLYQHANYQGTAETFSSRGRWLSDNLIGNDSASSLRYDGVFLFEHIIYNRDQGFAAKGEFFTGDDSSLLDNYIGNDAASSLCVGHNWEVTVYQHTGFGGASRVFGAGCYRDLREYYCGCGGDGTWNDQVSSIRVRRVGP